MPPVRYKGTNISNFQKTKTATFYRPAMRFRSGRDQTAAAAGGAAAEECAHRPDTPEQGRNGAKRTARKNIHFCAKNLLLIISQLECFSYLCSGKGGPDGSGPADKGRNALYVREQESADEYAATAAGKPSSRTVPTCGPASGPDRKANGKRQTENGKQTFNLTRNRCLI